MNGRQRMGRDPVAFRESPQRSPESQFEEGVLGLLGSGLILGTVNLVVPHSEPRG